MRLLLLLALVLSYPFLMALPWPGTDDEALQTWANHAAVAHVSRSPALLALGWMLCVELVGSLMGRRPLERLAAAVVLGAGSGLLAAVDLEAMHISGQQLVATPGWGFRGVASLTVVMLVGAWWSVARLAGRGGLWGVSALLAAGIPAAVLLLAKQLALLVQVGEISLLGGLISVLGTLLPLWVVGGVLAARGRPGPHVDGRRLDRVDQAVVAGALCLLPMHVGSLANRMASAPLGLHDITSLWTPSAVVSPPWTPSVAVAVLLALPVAFWLSSGSGDAAD